MSRSKVWSLESLDEFQDLVYERRWSDGLPVFPPLEHQVQAVIRYLGRDPEEEIGEIAPRRGIATIEKVAINAVMAGCKPEYVPVVLAAIEAMLAPEFNLQGVQTTTHSCEPLTIVSGPLVKQLGMSTGETVFAGGGARANVTIGRAIRLVLWNIGGGYPGEPCKKGLGHPGRFSYLVPEDPDQDFWEPLNVQAGFRPDQTTVTQFACEAPHNAGILFGTDMVPELMANVVADTMSTLGANTTHEMGEHLVVLVPSQAQIMAKAGWTKRDLSQYLFEKARRKLSELRPITPVHPDYTQQYWYPWWPESVDQSRADTMVPVAERAEDIHIIVSGGPSRWGAVCPGWGRHSTSVTRLVTIPG